ncbi:MAG: hypothetical protein K2N63_11400 [Lachnospiraceae bacterium]|nr:hypothetical protein [Lachnospiraceae bacterium]
MFVAERIENYVDLYSVSSIIGKEKRVYGKEAENYATIIPPENTENGFKVPSFIDCTKVYRVSLTSNADLVKLANREISGELRERILKRIKELRESGKQLVYSISEEQFRSWNPKFK